MKKPSDNNAERNGRDQAHPNSTGDESLDQKRIELVGVKEFDGPNPYEVWQRSSKIIPVKGHES